MIKGVLSTEKSLEAEQKRATNKWNAFINLVLIVSNISAVFFIVSLTRENTSLKRENAALQSEIGVFEGRLAGEPSAKVDDLVPSFEAVDIKGNRVQVTYNGLTKYLLYFFSPQCSVCDEQFPIWNRIAVTAKTKGYLPLGISLKPKDVTQEKLKGGDYKFDILIIPSEVIQRAYRIIAEPVVMAVSAHGTVDWVYYGGLTQDASAKLLAEIESNR